MRDPWNLEKRPLSKVAWEEGFTCSICEKWKPVRLMTVSLQESLNKLPKPTKKSFRRKMLKVVRKHEALWSKMYGESRDENMATS